MAPVQRGDWFFIRLPKYGPLAKSSLSLGFVRPMVFTDEQLQLIWWSSNSEDQWSKMLPLEIILFSIADIYYKALYSVVIFWICQKICFLLCYMLFLILPCRLRSLKYLLFAPYKKIFADPCVTWAWSFERLRMRGGRFVKEVEMVWALGDGSIRAGLGVRKDEGDLVPQCLGLLRWLDPPWCPSDGCCAHTFASSS